MAGNIAFGTDALRLEDTALFGVGNQDHARQFARRVLALPEVRSLTLEPETGGARIAYRAAPGDGKNVLARLADAIGTEAYALDDARIPEWPDGEAVTLSRAGDAITVMPLKDSQPDALREAHEALSAKNISGTRRKVPDPAPVPFGVANTTVGLGTIGELMLPVATPLAAGILVATKLNVVRDAAVDLSRGKVGVPLFDTALLACSIVTGQVLAYALTDWSLRYWNRRGRKQLAEETQQLLDETLPLPEQARVIDAAGSETVVPLALLRAGDRIRVAAGEPIPADGRVVAGTALVDETQLSGARAPVRKTVDDSVLAGARLVVGGLDILVERTGLATTASRISGTIIEAAAVVPREPALRRKAEQMTERTVLPTFATAAVGWAAGDLITVGAILHQDWISGPALAVPLLTLNHIRTALGSGALVRNGSAIPRLAESDFLVLDGDDPRLAAPGLELAEIESRLPDADTVLRHVAGAGLFLGDERSLALINACRERGLIIRQPALLALDQGRVEARLGEHTIRLSDEPVQGTPGVPDLWVEIDGHAVARLSFSPGARPRVAEAVQRLRAAGMQTFVVSRESDDSTNTLARRLGADGSGGELDAAGRIRFLQGLRRRGVKPVYVGRLAGQPDLAREAHVTVALGGLNGEIPVGDVLLLGATYDGLADLVELSRAYEPDLVGASRMATLPNLLCIAGAFGGLLNGITAGIVANMGVMNVDRRLRKTLEASARPQGSRNWVTLR
ncbi:MAG: cation-transporting ATPase [Methylococcaceae bacterium]|nr:cation-transporting ATPase [Methylococcaceae bacterium]